LKVLELNRGTGSRPLVLPSLFR